MEQILDRIRKFRDERNWMQFHDPKNLAISITIEAAELLEHFQWKNREQVDQYIITHKDDVADEIADVAIYLVELADNLGIDLIGAMHAKLNRNAEKYPVDKARGVATKYTDL